MYADLSDVACLPTGFDMINRTVGVGRPPGSHSLKKGGMGQLIFDTRLREVYSGSSHLHTTRSKYDRKSFGETLQNDPEGC